MVTRPAVVKPALLSVAALCILGLLMFHHHAQAVPTFQPIAPRVPARSSLRTTVTTADAAAPDVPHRRSIEDYTSAPLGRLFGAPITPYRAVTRRVTRARHARIIRPAPAAPTDPLKNFVYTGHVTSGQTQSALVENSDTQESKWLAVGDKWQGYIVAHIDEQGVRLKKGKTARELPLTDRIDVVQLVPDGSGEVENDPGDLTQYSDQTGKTLQFRVTGKLTGRVWGTDTYADRSNLATAAVHAGMLSDGQTGIVRVTIVDPTRYAGSTRNGVTSRSSNRPRVGYRVF